jgi:glycerol kinase
MQQPACKKDFGPEFLAGFLVAFPKEGELRQQIDSAYQTREVVEAMEMDSKINLDVLRADGGMVDDDLLMQFQADILNRNVVRPLIKETTALGSAYAAGLAVGFYKDLDELRANWGVDHTWKPQMDSSMREHLYKQWKKAVTRSFDWAA